MVINRNILIGERVRFYRTSKGLTQAEMASALPVPLSGQQLSKYENGDNRWPADTLIGIAIFLGIDIRLLTGLEDGKHEGKDSDGWEAERYKNILLGMRERARKVIYKIIDGVATL